MSAFAGHGDQFYSLDSINLYGETKIISYQPKPVAFFEFRIVDNPLTTAEKKECAPFVALPMLGLSSRNVINIQENSWGLNLIKELNRFLSRFYHPGNVKSRIISSPKKCKAATHLRIFNVATSASVESTLLGGIIINFLLFSALMFIVSLSGSLNSLLTRNLTEALQKTPKDDFSNYYEPFLFVCLSYFAWLTIFNRETLKQPSLYQEMHENEPPVLRGYNSDEQESNEIGNEEIEEQDDDDEDNDEEDDDEEDNDEEDDDEENNDEEDDDEEFIECDHAESDDKGEGEEEEEEAQLKLKRLLTEKEKFGRDVTFQDSTPLYLCPEEKMHQTVYVKNAIPIVAFQWPQDNQTHRLVISISNVWFWLLLSTILHLTFVPIVFSFIPRLLFALLFQSSVIQFPFHEFYVRTGYFWITKAMVILTAQVVKYYIKHEKMCDFKYIVNQTAKNALYGLVIGYFIPTYHTWSVIDTLHFSWILRLT